MRIRLLALCLVMTGTIAVPSAAVALQPPVSTTEPAPGNTENAVTTGNTADQAVDHSKGQKTADALAHPDLDPKDVFGNSVKILVELFVLAVLIESALAILFNWLPFQALFNARGVKPIISLVAAWALTHFFHTEILAKVVFSYGTQGAQPNPDAESLGQLLDAMIIAGGSAGVHTMLSKLGIRLPTSLDDTKPRPPASQAWLSITLIRSQVKKGPVQVQIAPVPPVGSAAVWETCGTIDGTGHLAGVARMFFRDRGRFPPNGGWSVDPHTPYLIQVSGIGAGGVAITAPTPPYGPISFAPGAIVDLDITL